MAFQTNNGKNYLTALGGGFLGIAATATKVGDNETFKVFEVGFDRVALQAANGRYVARNPQSGPRQGPNGQQQVDLSQFLLNATSFGIDPNAAFRVVEPKDSKWTYLQTIDGFYVSAVGGGGSLVDVALPLRTESAQLKAVCVDGDGTSVPRDGGDDGDRNWDPGLGG